MQDTLTEPKGIAFYNIKSDDTHYCKLEPQIQAYINSSDMGINASRDQDFGWRLAPEWVELVKKFRKDETRMERLTSRNGGRKVTVPQILYAIYGEQLRAFEQEQEDHEAPFEEAYLQKIANKPKQASDEEVDTDAAAEAATSDPEPSQSKPTAKQK